MNLLLLFVYFKPFHPKWLTNKIISEQKNSGKRGWLFLTNVSKVWFVLRACLRFNQCTCVSRVGQSMDVVTNRVLLFFSWTSGCFQSIWNSQNWVAWEGWWARWYFLGRFNEEQLLAFSFTCWQSQKKMAREIYCWIKREYFFSRLQKGQIFTTCFPS